VIGPASDDGRSRLARSRRGFSVALNSGHDAPSAARQAVIASADGLPAATRDDVLLVVSELVSNAVRHAGVRADQPIHVQVQLLAEEVLVEVVDGGPGFAREFALSARTESGGWGLFLVDRIAARWGVDHVAAGTRVWSEIPLPP
jgi:anti-sigma regulatory factor (Ser/Thr protein kinase)